MIICAAVVSKSGKLFTPDNLPSHIQETISTHANSFLYALSIEDDDVQLPYIETTNLRYIYKETQDLYWLLVTKSESDMFSDMDLLGRYVCLIIEYGLSDTSSGTLTDEQKDLFYLHIWRPWDEVSECSDCGRHCDCISSELWQREFESRLHLLNDVRDGHVDETDASYFKALILESWHISEKLTSKPNSLQEVFASESDSVCSSETRSISEEAVIDGCRLKCRLEDIRIEVRRLQDPYLRLFARRDLLVASEFHEINKISTAPSIEELDSEEH